MTLVLTILLYAMIAAGLAAAAYAVWVEWRARAAERSDIARRRRARDAGREGLPADAILDRFFPESRADREHFRRVWYAVSRAVEMNPQLLRPTDRVADIIVSSEHLGPDSVDFVDLLSEFLPQDDPFSLLEEVAGGEGETVGDWVTFIVDRGRLAVRPA